MRLHVIFRQLGRIYLFSSIFLFIAAVISLVHQESAALPLLYSTFISVLFGVFPLIFVPNIDNLKASEGVFIVVFGWVSTCLIGTLPYVLWGGEFSLANAWFESVSGFTTTGSTILNNVEALPMGLLFWRSATHWIGGVGVIIFALLIVPATSQSRVVLFNSEMSPIAKENFKYKTQRTLQILVVVYVGLTLAETLFLWFFGMSLFDAINHAFSTIATGGFSTKNLSVAYFDSVPIEVTIMVFMALSGIHFGLIFNTITGKSMHILRSPVVVYYLVTMIFGVLAVTVNLYHTQFQHWGSALRYASFQVISVATTTGFANYDSANWPAFSKLIILFFTLQCACAGSTSGGIKVDRVLIFWKSVINQIRLLQHPRAIFMVKMKGKSMDTDIVSSAMIFIILYIVIVFITTVILAAMGVRPHHGVFCFGSYYGQRGAWLWFGKLAWQFFDYTRSREICIVYEHAPWPVGDFWVAVSVVRPLLEIGAISKS